MYELLQNLPSDSLALDVGSDEGSFPQSATSATIIRVDRELPQSREEAVHFVQCDAASLPFVNETFAVVISNHSLEHIVNFAGALGEIGRVVRSDGSLFVAVPDATTFTDKLYRWLARGGRTCQRIHLAWRIGGRDRAGYRLASRRYQSALCVPFVLESLSESRSPPSTAASARRGLRMVVVPLRVAVEAPGPAVQDTGKRIWLGVLFWQCRSSNRHDDMGQRLHEVRKRMSRRLLD